jgi:hypothetical protein
MFYPKTRVVVWEIHGVVSPVHPVSWIMLAQLARAEW